MNASLKLFLWWLCVAAGAVLVLAAPFTLKGVAIGAVGAVLLVYGLIPIMRKRKADREQSQGKKP